MTAPCVHYWRIETPHGSAQVSAHCDRCAMTRTFPAGGEDNRAGWNEPSAGSERENRVGTGTRLA